MLYHKYVVKSSQRVGFFNVGSCRVLEKIPGSGSGLGRVGIFVVRDIEVSFFHLVKVFFIGTAKLTFRGYPLPDYFQN